MITLKKAEKEDANFRATVDGHVKSIADGRAYIILNDGAPVGVIAYTMFWEELPFLTLIKLLPEYRLRGFGREAIALFEEELKKLGFCALLVSTQTDEEAQHFYRKAGYRECGCLILDGALKQPMEMFFIKSF